MINNYWEDLRLEEMKMGEIHEKLLSEMEIPSWLKIKCPFCGKEQPLRSIRSFGIKLNPRNMCDIFAEICCYDCKQMDTVYFRDEISKVTDFVDFINDKKIPKSSPVIEEEMYKAQYNNMLEKAIRKIGESKTNRENKNGNS